MLVLKNQLLKSKLFPICWVGLFLLTTLSVYVTLKSDDLTLLPIFLFMLVFMVIGVFFVKRRTIVVNNEEMIYSTMLSNKKLSYQDISSVEIQVLPVIAFINLLDNKNKVIIPHLSAYFRSKDQCKEFVQSLREKNSRIKVNIDWDSFSAKHMIW